MDNAFEQGESKCLEGLLYTVFGCGNQNWHTYQSFPIKVDSMLEELGAERFFIAGQGDADSQIDSHFQEWSAHFWVRTLQYYGLDTSSPSNPVVPGVPVLDGTDFKVLLKYIPVNETEKWRIALENKNIPANATVSTIRELQNTRLSNRSTCHIDFDVSKVTPLSTEKLYEPGDHLEIMPENNENLVNDIAIGFGLVLDSVFEVSPDSLDDLSPRSLAATIKGPCTVRNALKYYADLSSPPSRNMLGIFAKQLQAIAPEIAATFESLTTPGVDGEDRYPKFIAQHRTLLDLQRGFPQVKQLELDQFLAVITVMQTRRYSIASATSVQRNIASITVGVVNDTVNGNTYPGLASSYLSKLQANSPVRMSFRSAKNTFNLPENHKIPLILIAAGTGLAPFMGFLQERSVQKDAAPCVVYYGCRHPDQDYIYKDELAEFVDRKVISNLEIVYSRLDSGSPKKYVQHAILSQAGIVWQLMHGNKTALPASVYVCGANSMSRCVRSAFENMAQSFGEAQSTQEAKDYINDLTKKRRYNEDTWA